MTVRLLLVISSPTTSDSIRGALRNDQPFGPVAEIFEAHEDIHRVIAQLSPDVIIIDRDLPGADGIALADEVLRTHPQIAPALILLADAYHQGDAVRAARAGVRGYLLKDQEAWLLCAAIRAVASGAGWLSPAAAGELLGELRDSITLRPYRLQPGLDRLTQRERSVIRLVALGYSNIEIAGQLMLGASTIRTHVSRMLAKLDLRTRAQLAAIAGKNGLE